jgi:hypothetical protein
MLDPKGWLDLAQSTPLGRSRRGEHDCGAGKVLIVNHKPDGWSAWCHRCHEPGWVSKAPPTLEERRQRQAALDAAEHAMRKSVALPYPAEFDVAKWPLQARVWLYKAGLLNEDIAQLGAYWHEPSQRVVVPVMDGDTVLHWQARNVGLVEGPKYLGPKADASKVIPRFGSDGPLLVLCEDLLSTFRVGMASEALCLMGTVLHDATARLVMLLNKPVAIWLDPDKAGDRGYGDAKRKLDMLGVQNTKIVSTKDPKNLSRAEVAQHIAEAATCMGILK